MIIFNIANNYTKTPGGRYISDGDFSAEYLRDEIIVPIWNKSSDKIRFEMDGGAGYAISFIEELFGGLARKYGTKTVLDKIEIVSEEDPKLKTRIYEFIYDVDKEYL